MNAKKCDRCGVYYDKNINTFGFENKPLTQVIAIHFATGTTSRHYDLCDDCMKKFLYDFILMGREPENKNG